MKKALYFLFLLFLLVFPLAFAKEGSMKLLAVKESNGGFNGSIADLHLEIKEGSGRVFLETFPLTKVDTQLSTRFAKEVSCDYLNEDCSRLDFFYTIRSQSSIVGGPSAGAAITFLTMALLDDMPIDPTATITGTINSGGIIGHVGGVKAKIDAAANAGLTKVLISKGAIVKEGNETIDIKEYGKEKGVEVLEASTVEDMIYLFTGIVAEEQGNLTIDPTYSEIMKGLTGKLCGRSDKLKIEIKKFDPDDKENTSRADELYGFAMDALDNELHYTAASYCYGANVKYRHTLYQLENLSESARHNIINFAQRDLSKIKKKLTDSDIQTITDLEAFMIVTDRVIEAEKYIKKAIENVNNTDGLYDLSTGMERIYSAYTWYAYFVHEGKKLKLDEEALRESCQNKIAEAEERYQYVSLFLSKERLKSTRDVMGRAYTDFNKGDYALCLFKASKAKAEADIILSAFNVEEEQIDMLLQQKLDVARGNIIRQANKEIFPVIGYSYYEYGNSLKETDKYSALLYAEYALELSALDIYFKDAPPMFEFRKPSMSSVWIFVWGLSIGVIAGLLIKVSKHVAKKRRARKANKKKK